MPELFDIDNADAPLFLIKHAAARHHFANSQGLDIYHTFATTSGPHPQPAGVANLEVANEIYLAPGSAIGPHLYHQAEVIMYMLAGTLEQDGELPFNTLTVGDVQLLSTGTGLLHGEHNPSMDQPAHFLRFWLQGTSHAPAVAMKHFALEQKQAHLRLIASPDAHHDTLKLHTQALIYACVLDIKQSVHHEFADNRVGYLYVARGSLSLTVSQGSQELNDEILHTGDSGIISPSCRVEITCLDAAEFLLFELPDYNHLVSI